MFLPQRTALSLGLMVTAIFAVAGLSLWTLRQRELSRARTAHGLNVLMALDDVLALAQAVEGSERAYLLSDAPSARARYDADRRELVVRLQGLEELTLDNAAQHQRVLALQLLAQRELEALAVELEEREVQAGDPPSGPLRAAVHDARRAEERSLESGFTSDGAFAARTVGAVLVGTALLLAFAVISSLLVRGDFLARAAAEAEAARAQRRTRALISRLSQTNAELDRFAHVASHDLKAPLRGIASLTRWLEESLAARVETDTREQLRLLRERAQRLEGIIDGILAYSRAGQKTARSRAEQVDADRLVTETVELLSPPLGARVERKSPLPVLRTERVPFQQVWMNLVGNALKYCRRLDPVVELSARDAGRFWDFAVKDNGPGIAPEDQARIWGLFQTAGAAAGGSGIGLSVVRKIVEGKGGRAWVESAPGHGATFHFTWPKQEVGP
jgi:signal transduction histidine kinase